MDDLENIQKAIFQQINGNLAPDLSLVHEIAQILEISYDGSCRSIRGDKVLSFEELYVLCKHCRISVDFYCGIASNKVVFDCRIVDPESLCVIDWLRFVLPKVENFRSATESEIIYPAKYPPIFHYFQFPEISAFIAFFWEKILNKFPNLKGSLFCLDDVNPEIQKEGRQIISLLQQKFQQFGINNYWGIFRFRFS